MKITVLVCFLMYCSLDSFAIEIPVKNLEELHQANKKAKPGDVVQLQNGEWKDVIIKLDCSGTKEQPIKFKAQTAGKVIVTGHSQLRLGGNHIIVEGLNFINGYAGNEAVISFRIDSKKLANDCRVTNCNIRDFNNPKRMDENNWVLFYGKNNRLDHCNFVDKKNMGVLIAVILDDDRSRENFHSIDHNYFGRRLPLASNGGEIIRVGVSQHCEFNSNTQITDNYFEHCDGETEIISIKSGSNVVRRNLFKECQGGVVLRHGNYNLVENNIFLGNFKEGTGGVRVINKGQWVVNNFFYRCRGVDFRSPLSIMNGIPNSPAHRYVQVTDAVIANNTWVECSPISLCEGSDAERTLPPDNVLLMNNVFYNTKDSLIYKVFDNTSGFRFVGNELNQSAKIKNQPIDFLVPRELKVEKSNSVLFPVSKVKGAVAHSDSIRKKSMERLGYILSTKPGFADLSLLKTIEANALKETGIVWGSRYLTYTNPGLSIAVKCTTAEEIHKQLEKNKPVSIELIGTKYTLDKPLQIKSEVTFIAPRNPTIFFTTKNISSVFQIGGGGKLILTGLTIDGKGVSSTNFISSSDQGPSAHYNLDITRCTIKNLDRQNGCRNFFYAYKSMVADEIMISTNRIESNNVDFFMMNEEKDDKGYYNAEKIYINNNTFNLHKGKLIEIYRGGNDESTLGPQLGFTKNKLNNCTADSALIHLTGVQVSRILKNDFSGTTRSQTIVSYKDIVRARHYHDLGNLKSENNQFVIEEK